MDIKDLLKPRYKVMADYPNNPYKVGWVMTPDREYWLKHNIKLCDWSVEKYPHLFRKLEWWEERPLEDLPLFIRFGNLDGPYAIYKITAWNTLGKNYSDYEPCGLAEIPHEYFISLRFPNNHPATEDEYRQYLQNKNS